MRTTYPSKDFVRRAQRTIRNRERLEIEIEGMRRRKILAALLPLLMEDGDADAKERRSPSWRYVASLFLFARLFSVHFYALSGDFKLNYEGGGEKLVLMYSPPNQTS